MSETEDKKPETKGETLSVCIRDQTGEETFFKVKKTTKLEKVFNAYAERKGVNSSSLRFLLDGVRVRPEQTPTELDMEDNDQLDCMLEQQGGAFFLNVDVLKNCETHPYQSNHLNIIYPFSLHPAPQKCSLNLVPLYDFKRLEHLTSRKYCFARNHKIICKILNELVILTKLYGVILSYNYHFFEEDLTLMIRLG
mmetsp:Transcript_10612/g.13189  ORF Transcript_10612/g.13189 Transcript_10612/m.13189 type:complete len:195 (+) Transcript_10612:77-661(+)